MRLEPEAALMRLAEPQHSVFTAKQARSVGFGRRTIATRVDAGLWRPMYGRTFVLASVEITWRQRITAALLACGPQSFASHRSAGAIWDVVPDVTTPEITLPHENRSSVDGILIHRTLHVECMNRKGFRVATPMRTLLDMAAVLSAVDMERALDNTHRRGRVDLRRFRAYLHLEQNLRLPGTADLRRMVAARDPDSPIASDLESPFFAMLRQINFPLPVPQYRVVVPSGRERFIDFAYPVQRIAVELDSYTFHGGPKPFTPDRARQNEIEAMGWHFFRFTWEQVTSRSVAYLIPLADALDLEPSRWRKKRTKTVQRRGQSDVSA